jgi:hypothetical protein
MKKMLIATVALAGLVACGAPAKAAGIVTCQGPIVRGTPDILSFRIGNCFFRGTSNVGMQVGSICGSDGVMCELRVWDGSPEVDDIPSRLVGVRKM